MEQIFISLTKSDLQDIIAETVNACLRRNTPAVQPAAADLWMNIEDLCRYLPDRPTKATVYGWVHAGILPVHKGGKKLRFLKSEIDVWLKQGKKKTDADYAAEADKYLSSIK